MQEQYEHNQQSESHAGKSGEEIKSALYDTGDDIDVLITLIPELPPLYNSRGEEVNKEELINTIQAVREGLGGFLRSITNEYGLRTLVESQVYAEQISKQIDSKEDINDLIFALANEIPELKRINGEEIDKSALVSTISEMLSAVEKDEVETIKEKLNEITRRFGLRKKVKELITQLWYEKHSQKEVAEETKEATQIPSKKEFSSFSQQEKEAKYENLYEMYYAMKRKIPELDGEERQKILNKMEELRPILNSMHTMTYGPNQ